MHYRDSIEKSAEYLRLALPLMSKQAAALHPVSYAIWYEYVAACNLPLRASIDQLLQRGAVLDEQTTNALFQQHIADINQAAAKRISTGFQKVMADMSSSAEQTGDQAGLFGNALEKWRSDLIAAPPGTTPTNDAIIGLTQEMQGSIISLKEHLAESRREIEQLRQEVIKARGDALVDGLTEMTNRRGFDLAIAACLADGDPGGTNDTCLLMTDIDHFKKVNDTYGHLFGDKVIRAVAQILKQNVKGKDTAARYGGEEFVILLPETPIEGARHLAEKIRMAVEGCRIKRSSDKIEMAKITVSLGVTAFRRGESAAEFVARADAALYASKNNGRNCVTVATA